MIKNSILVVILRGLSALLQFGVIFFITNTFAPKIIGKYDLVFSILNIFGSLCVVGMNHSIIYYSGVFKAENSSSSLWNVYKKMIKIMGMAAGLFFFMYLLVSKDFINSIYDEDVYTLLLKAFAVLGFHALLLLNIDALRALGKLRISELYRSILKHLSLFFFVFVLYLTHNDEYLSDALLLNSVVLSIASTFVVVKGFKKLQSDQYFTKKESSLKEIFIQSYPMSISMIAFLFLQSTDIILLGAYEAFDKVAYYSRAVQLTLLVSMVLHAVNTVYAPKIAELYSLNDEANVKINIKKSTRLIFIASILPIIFLFIFSDSILTLFGKDYAEASFALKVLMIGQIFNVLTGSVGMYMNMTNKQNTLQYILISALVINFLLNILLIPHYGLVGAALATTISTAGWNIYGSIYLFLKDNIKTFLH